MRDGEDVDDPLAGSWCGARPREPGRPRSQPPIKIGELNSYAKWAAFTVPYRDGWQLALDEINAKGGVLGRKIEVISRDDGSTTG